MSMPDSQGFPSKTCQANHLPWNSLRRASPNDASRLLDGGTNIRVVILVLRKRSRALHLLSSEQALSRGSACGRIAARIRDARSERQAEKVSGPLEENAVALSRCSPYVT